MIKKILAKLVLTNLILMNVAFIMPQTLSADEHDGVDIVTGADGGTGTDAPPAKTSKAQEIKKALGDPLDDAKKAENQCVKTVIKNGEKVEKGPDEGYIITIIEEPLYEETIGKTAVDGYQGDDYVSRICYRNYFTFTPQKELEVTTSELSTMCSESGKNAFLNTALQKEYNIRFTCQRVQVLLTRGGSSALAGYVNVIYRWAASIVGIIAVTVIIISAIQISLAGGESTGIDEAKKRIMQSLLGIAILFLSGLILNFINPNFFTY